MKEENTLKNELIEEIKGLRREIDLLLQMAEVTNQGYFKSQLISTLNSLKKERDRLLDELDFDVSPEQDHKAIADDIVKVYAHNYNYITPLFLAKGWLGKMLGALGDISPYAANDGKRKTEKDIAPTAERVVLSEVEHKFFFEMSGVQRLDYLREEVQKVIEKFADILKKKMNGIMRKINGLSVEAYNGLWSSILESRQELTKARMLMGGELGRIRDAGKKDSLNQIKLKSITIKSEPGELIDGNFPPSEIFPVQRKVSTVEAVESTSFVVNCTLYQPETNAKLQQTKHFKDFPSAESYLKKFIKVNPLSEVMLYEESQKMLLVYDSV